MGNQMGGYAMTNGRYSTTSNTVQANQVIPLGSSSQNQLSSPFGAFAPSTSEGLDARLRQEMFQKQKEYEAGANVHSQQDLSASYAEYMRLRDQWFAKE
jgi:hypothetical protein